MLKAKTYRDRAEECRAIASQLRPGAQQNQLLDMAEEWERMALQRDALLRATPQLAGDEPTDADTQSGG